MRRWIVVATLLVCGLPSAASAELTNAEKYQVHRLYLAASDLATAQWYVGHGASDTTSANRAAIHSAIARIAGAQRSLDEAIALLLGLPIDQSGTWQTRTRPEYLAGAQSRLSAAVTNSLTGVPTLQSYLTTAQNTAATPTGQDDFRRARDIWVANAIAKINGFSWALGYWDPTPVDAPQIVGPHGDYVRAGAHAIASLQFANDVWWYARALYVSDPLWTQAEVCGTLSGCAPFAWLFRVALRAQEAAVKVRAAMLRWALVPTSASDCARNRFHLVGFSLLPMLSHTSESGFDGIAGLPYHNNQLIGDNLATWLRMVVARPAVLGSVQSLLQRWSDFWRYADGAAKVVMEFPDPSRLDGVGDTSSAGSPMQPVPFGPPVCP